MGVGVGVWGENKEPEVRAGEKSFTGKSLLCSKIYQKANRAVVKGGRE